MGRSRKQPPVASADADTRLARVLRLQARRRRWIERWQCARAQAEGGLDAGQARDAAWALSRAVRCSELIHHAGRAPSCH
jgi:hypothetical protein